MTQVTACCLMAQNHYLKITNLRLQTHFPGANGLNIYSLSDSGCIIASTKLINFQMLKDMHLFSVSHGNPDLAGASPQISRPPRDKGTPDHPWLMMWPLEPTRDQYARNSKPRFSKAVSQRKQNSKRQYLIWELEYIALKGQKSSHTRNYEISET